MMRNQSGMPDPTAEAAISNVILEQCHTAKRPLVYICCSGLPDGFNVSLLGRCCAYAVERRRTPLAPQLFFPLFLGEERTAGQREASWAMRRQMLKVCRELWWFGDKPTQLTRKEIQTAVYNGLTIRHFTSDCQEISIKY